VKEQFEYYIQGLKDPRSMRNQRHPLISLIGTTFLAALSGIDSFSGIQDFVEMHFESITEYFDFPNGPPSHDTYQRLWGALNPAEFENSFHEFTKSLEKISGKIISIDGKTIRNSGHEKALHILNAWCHANQLTLAQEKVDGKSNEITAIPKLLELLNLKDHIVTIDAMGAQRSICQKIVDQEGDYVISLKGNQTTLHEDVKLYLKDPLNHQMINENNDKGHGRIEQRVAAITHDIKWLQETHEWPGLKCIGKITSRVFKKGRETTETRYYISSLPLTAQELNDIARAHWGIENQLHWRLDVIFNEDKACIREDCAAQNMDTLRKWSLNILSKAKTKPEQSLKGLMRKNAMSFKHLCSSVKAVLRA